MVSDQVEKPQSDDDPRALSDCATVCLVDNFWIIIDFVFTTGFGRLAEESLSLKGGFNGRFCVRNDEQKILFVGAYTG